MRGPAQHAQSSRTPSRPRTWVRRPRFAPWVAAGLLLAGAAACEPSTPYLPTDGGLPDVELPDQTLTSDQGQSDLPPPKQPPPLTLKHSALPAALQVEVTDEQGKAITGARVVVGDRGARTDDRGRARFLRLPPGSHVVHVSHDSYVEQARTIPLIDADRGVLPVTLRARSAAVTVDAAAGGTVTSGSMTLTLPPGALVDLSGKAFVGKAQVRLTAFGTGKTDLAAFPASLVGTLAAGGSTALVTYGAFEATITDSSAAARPLRLAAGKKVEVATTLPASTTLSAGDQVPMWVLDPVAGSWREEAGVLATAVAQGGGLVLKASLPHLSIWNFDRKGSWHCYVVNVDVPDWALERAALTVHGQGYFRRGAVPRDKKVEVVRVPGSDAEVSLLANDTWVAAATVTPKPWDKTSNCPGPTVTLSWSTTPVTGGDGVLRLLLTCSKPLFPRAGQRVALTNTTTNKVLFDGTMPGPYHEFPKLPEGDYRIAVYSTTTPATPPVTRTFTVPKNCKALGTCVQTVTVSLGEKVAFCTTEGPWVPDRCVGSRCRSCLDLYVRDGKSAPVSRRYVSFYAPVMQAHPTDDNGQICLDVAKGAGQELVYFPEGGTVAAVSLPLDATCDTGGCAARVARVLGDTLSCGSGSAPKVATARIMGLLHPGYTADSTYEPPYAVQSAHYVAATGTTTPLTQLLGANAAFGYDQAFGFVRTHQDALGTEQSEDTVIRAVITEPCTACKPRTMGLSLELDTAATLLTLGKHKVGSGTGALGVEVITEKLEKSATPDVRTYRATGGEIDVLSREGNHVLLDVKLDLVDAAVSTATMKLSALLWVPILSQADTPVRTTAQLSHYLNGVSYRVLSVAGKAESYGPAGSNPTVKDKPRGEAPYCLPQSGAFMLVGEPAPGKLAPFTALQRLQGSTVLLHGNTDPRASAFATLRLRWFDETYVDRFYAANNLVRDPTKATLLGVAMQVVQSGGALQVKRLTDFKVMLTPHGGTGGVVGIPHDTQFARTKTPSGAFFFPNVAPTTTDKPYTLTLLDSAGNDVSEYRQKIAPVAGGVMITHN